MQEAGFRRLSSLQLVGRLINDVSELVNKQMELARVEARENIFGTLTGAKYLAIGAFLLLTAWISLVVAGILALALVMPGWLAAIIVAALFAVVGGILAWIGKNDVATKPLARTRETLKENMEWARHRSSSSAM